MNDSAARLRGDRWHSNKMHNRHPLRARARDAVQRAQFTDTKSCRQHADAAHSRISIGHVRRVQFIRTTNPLQASVATDCVRDWKRIVARHTEDMLRASLCESIEDVLNNRSRCNRHARLIHASSRVSCAPEQIRNKTLRSVMRADLVLRRCEVYHPTHARSNEDGAVGSESRKNNQTTSTSTATAPRTRPT